MKKLLTVSIIFIALQGIAFADIQTDTSQYYIRQIQAENVAYTSCGFFKAIKEGNAGLVEKFLKAGMSPNTTIMKYPAISVAIKYNHNSIVKLLLDHGAKINPVAENTTPLITAIKHKNPEIVSTLIKYGANVNQIADGLIPLNYAVKKQNTEIVEKLIKAGAITNEDVLASGLKSRNENIKNLVLIHYKATP